MGKSAASEGDLSGGPMSSDFPTEGMQLTHLLVVRDLERSRAFYRDVLGAELYREYGGTSVVLLFLLPRRSSAGDQRGQADSMSQRPGQSTRTWAPTSCSSDNSPMPSARPY